MFYIEIGVHRYLNKHPSLRPHMRMILVEWLVSLQGRYKLLQETLLMTVSVLDRFMSETGYEVSRSKFQLVGEWNYPSELM